MKKFIYTMIAASLLISCDDRFDFLSGYNKPPVVTLVSTGNNTTTSKSTPNGMVTNSGNSNTIVLQDSVKIMVKHGQINYPFVVSITDSNVTGITAAITNGSASVQLNGANVPSSIPTTAGQLQFSLSKFVAGEIDFVVIATDAFNSTATIKLLLVAFENLDPVASFSYAANNVNGDPLQYSFDASKSFDKDQRFGGGIQAYQWTVNGKTLPPITTSVMNWVFPTTGGYKVQLVAVDNDGKASPPITQQVTVK